MNNYLNAGNLVLEEIKNVIISINAKQVEDMIDALCKAEKVFVIGVGRVLLMMKAFAKRLNHLGIKANYVGAINEPPIESGDILIIGSGSGETAIPAAIGKVAKEKGAKIIYIGSNSKSTVAKIADLVVRIPCRTKLNLQDEINSQQPLSSLFEQSLLVFTDIVSYMIIKNKNIDINSLWKKHANLE